MHDDITAACFNGENLGNLCGIGGSVLLFTYDAMYNC